MDLPAEFCFRQMMVESGGNPKAKSSAGAMGLFQLMGPTAAELSVTDPYDPDQSCRGGTEYDAKILADLKIHYGQNITESDYYRLMFTGYNCGPGYVHAALRECRARDLPTQWSHFATLFPLATVRGRKPDAKQALNYALKILPLEEPKA